MDKRLLALALAVLVSSLLVIDMRHRNRVHFVALQTLQNQRDALDIERGQLLLEEGTWAEHRRVEDLARTRLGMALPLAEQVEVVYADGETSTRLASGDTPALAGMLKVRAHAGVQP